MEKPRYTHLMPAEAAVVPGGVKSLRVTVLDGPNRGWSCVVDKPVVVIGRSADADVRLEDVMVSQRHVELCCTDRGLLVCDLGSRNGVRVGGVRLERAIVPYGTTLVVGSTPLRVQLGDDPEMRSGIALGDLVGESPAVRALYGLLERIASTELSLLIEGETGTGKELVARAMHRIGPRAGGPFVVLDCTALPVALAPSLLFGHEKGAFTGATERHIGLFAAADGGVLLLDEVGELPVELQPLLLRVLQRREFIPVGSTRPRSVDVRIVAATWRHLPDLVKQGRFREDLYYRLAQATVRVPSLRERTEDIGPLVRHFLERRPTRGRGARGITPEALQVLAGRQFPGNVRELQSTVERLALMGDGPLITMADLALEFMLIEARTAVVAPLGAQAAAGLPGAAQPPQPQPQPQPFKAAKREAIERFERAYLSKLMESCSGNLSQAANLAELERHNLRELLKKHGLYGNKE